MIRDRQNENVEAWQPLLFLVFVWWGLAVFAVHRYYSMILSHAPRSHMHCVLSYTRAIASHTVLWDLEAPPSRPCSLSTLTNPGRILADIRPAIICTPSIPLAHHCVKLLSTVRLLDTVVLSVACVGISKAFRRRCGDALSSGLCSI